MSLKVFFICFSVLGLVAGSAAFVPAQNEAVDATIKATSDWKKEPVKAMPEADQEKEAAALRAAEEWLELVDENQYAATWNTAAGFFKKAVAMGPWAESLKVVRGSLGKLIARESLKKIYMTSLPGAPDGEYFVIQFETVFENKKEAIETVTSMLDEDGQWRVSGYYIK